MTRVLFLIVICLSLRVAAAQVPAMEYVVTISNPENHQYHVELQTSGWNVDTLALKLPRWMPGYYQFMDYARAVRNVEVKDAKGKPMPFIRSGENTIRIAAKEKTFTLSYDVGATRQFVAESYVDGGHAYLIPEASFFYVDGSLDIPVRVTIKNSPWKDIVTGLEPVVGKSNQFSAPDFDILYDCPLLLGNLKSLPSFLVKGVEHRFIGYQLGKFDASDFITKLQKVSEAATDVIGDIPFSQYTYIAIGPGRGGIEHLNNTTVSFDGNELTNPDAVNGMMNFLAHEYFHHYNVKRIRPLELGPFDYQNGSRTNLLWVSEGLSVYYEYLIVRRAGVTDERVLLENFERDINAIENNPGRHFQSLTQSSYNTWSDGPFGNNEPGKTISYYEKGPVVGLLLDFAIRHETKNAKSLDDVMRLVYWRYYKKAGRGFSDAEFQQACEEIAGGSLAALFEYVNTTKELDYAKYLGYGGLKLEVVPSSNDNASKKFKLQLIESRDALQQQIFNTWQSTR